MAQYYMSWELGRDRQRPRPGLSRRILIRMGLILLALLLLVLLILLVILGNEARKGESSNGAASNPVQTVALPVHAGYVFMLPDFIPGADAPGLPDLTRSIWDFAWGCSAIVRLLVLAALPLAMIWAYRRGLRRGQEEDG